MTTSDQIIQVLSMLFDKFGVAVDWTADNILPYVQQLMDKYIAYEIATSWVWIGSFLGVVLIFGVLRTLSYFRDWEDSTQFALTVCLVIAGIIAIGVVICQVLDIVTCYTFPEKMILDYIRELIKSS